ncbi:MAG: hypothetical protein EBR10_11115 [Planctomycetes bacterium]|nr:hypothetical protein [Planctomycetota bacterium]
MIPRVVLAVCALALLVNCERTDRIAVIFDETGSQAALGTAWTTATNHGAARVFERWKSARVDRADSRSSASTAAVVGERLRSEGASIGLGFTDSDIAVAGIRAFLSANAAEPECAAPFVVVGATDPPLL